MKIRYFGFAASLALLCSAQVHAATIYEFDTPVVGSVTPSGTVSVTVTGSTATFVVSLPSNDVFNEFALILNSGAVVNPSSAYSVTSNFDAADFSQGKTYPNYGHFNTLLTSTSSFGSTLTFSVSDFVSISDIIVNSQPIWFVAASTSPAWAIASDAIVTPLPATLPLFASGLGALGLLSWRAKRKRAAVV